MCRPYNNDHCISDCVCMSSWLQLLKIQELRINYTGYTGKCSVAPEINLHYVGMDLVTGGSCLTCRGMPPPLPSFLSNEVLVYWYLHFLSLVVDCGSLDNPLNGAVDISQGTTYNAMATYSCNSPYTLNGDMTRTCQADGDWSGGEPTCGRFDH